MLAGTGATLSPRFEPSEAALALGSGALMGVVAVALVTRGMVTEGPLASLHGATGSGGRRRSVPRWLLPAGVALAGAALVVMQRFGRGATPFAAGQGALFLGSFGALGATLMLAPRLARRLTGALVRRAPVDGLLVRVEVDRLPVRVAATVTTLAMGTALAVAFASIAPLGARTTSQGFAEANGPGFLVTTQQPWDQREGSVSEAVAAAIRGLPEVGSVSTRWRAVVSDETEPRLVVAFDGPAADHAVTPLAGTAVPSALAGEGVALSRIAAARLGAGPGDTVTLPTLTGPASFTVSGVFDPVVVDDTTVGDWVLTDPATARHRFGSGAVRGVGAGVSRRRAGARTGRSGCATSPPARRAVRAPRAWSTSTA